MLVIALSFVAAAVGNFFGTREDRSALAEESQGVYDFYSSSEFYAYVTAYNGGARNKRDTLNFYYTSGTALTDEGYTESLGTSGRPFAGTIVIGDTGIDEFDLYTCPLFNYVSTKMSVENTSGTAAPININKKDTANSETGGTLFANHVVKESDSDYTAKWSISLLSYEGNTETGYYEGVIGDIGKGCDVTVNYTVKTNLRVVRNTDNVGLICGTLGEAAGGATLRVNTPSGCTASAISVSTTSGHAGGLVGEMKTNSVLEFKSVNRSGVTKVSTTGDGKYAGGIVGYVNDALVKFDPEADDFLRNGPDFTVYGTTDAVVGKAGAGGLFGYYYSSTHAATTISLATYTITSGLVVRATSGYAGGIIGWLSNDSATFTYNGNAELTTESVSGTSYAGGVIGYYSTNALSNKLIITNVNNSVSSLSSGGTSGGLIGGIVKSAAYVHIDGATGAINTNTGANGGLIGSEGGGDSFIDVTGSVTVRGSHGGGLIYNMPSGVLRIAGQTNLSGATIGAGGGQIVKTRGRSLVYALGSGTNYSAGTGWTLTRKNNTDADDLYTWGEVVRLGASGITESDLFAVDESAHTVQVRSGGTSIGTKIAFAKTALNIQLNTATTNGTGALRFESVSNPSVSETLLSSTLTFTDSVNMSGTGINSFTRDDGVNEPFTGSVVGGSTTLTIDTGAPYGNPTTPANNCGGIHSHCYVGLFAKVNGSTISNFTIAGTMNIRPAANSEDVRCVGPVAAFVQGAETLTSVTSSPTITVTAAEDNVAYVGGAIGYMQLNASVTITNGTYGATINDTTNTSGNPIVCGGVVGDIGENSERKCTTDTVFSITGATLSSTYYQENSSRTPYSGALIGRIEHAQYVYNKRAVSISGVTVNYTVSKTTADANGKSGGILGTDWFTANVTITGLAIDDTHITAVTRAVKMGGLVNTATGHWDIISLSVDADGDHDVVIITPGSSTFGFVANKAYRNGSGATTSSALYLDVDNTSTNYNIGNLYMGASNDLGSNYTVFDELVADSRYNNADISANGNAVISVTTTDGNPIVFTGSGCNTYQNKTVAGKNARGKHGNTRYYYNLKAIRNNGSATNAQKFLIWSVKIYAHSSLSNWFTKSAFSGTLNMTGLSYYPVNLSGVSVTFSSATLTLDNNGIEASENNQSGADTIIRDTRTAASQHYLMHTSTFLNVTGRISINGLTICGNVPKLSDSHCGFLIAGSLGGTESGVVTHNDGSASNIVFNGAFITSSTYYNAETNPDSHLKGDDIDIYIYAPLLINKALRNSTIVIDGASQSSTHYSSYKTNGWYAASSLIGDVGAADAKSITLTFTKLRFDGRTKTSGAPALNYGTGRSIFSRATILNSFKYLEQASGTDNFTNGDDWTGSAHKVTYGWELSHTVEYAGEGQNVYYPEEDVPDYYVSPSSGTAGSAYDFTVANFLPYVYTAYSAGDKQHELAVNIYVEIPDITGCGKYGDPYLITDGNMLYYIATVIAGTVTDTNTGLTLPSDIASPSTAVVHPGDVVYKYDGSGYFTATDKTPVGIDVVREYLAGAYYLIQAAKIELPTTFPGLGAPNNDDSNPEYFAFRGVIVGDDDYDDVISNASINPLVYTSNGCVIKDVTVEVNCASTISFTYSNYTGSFTYKNGSKAYGAVIGQVLGGDTVIDNVSVTYTTATFSFNDAVYTRLAPVGGYIGVVLNGGVIFRNMAGKTPTNFSNKLDRVNDSGYLYVNPIIGRVITGYAFQETTGVSAAYHATEATSTLKNGSKNYSIPDLNAKTFGTLNVSGNTINVPDGQALFLLSVIVNSGAGSASSAAGDYNTAKLTNCWQAYRAYCATRGTAKYDDLGNQSTDYTASTADGYSGLARTPYIITKYATAAARTVCSDVDKTVEIKGDCELPECFRGIGSIYVNDPLVRLRARYFRGYSGTQYEITLHTNYLEYNVDRSNGNLSYKFFDSTLNYGYWVEVSVRAIGVINQFIAKSANITLDVSNLKLAGDVRARLFRRDTGEELSEYLFSSAANGGAKSSDPPLATPASNGIGGINGVSVAVGGFIGYVYNNGKTPTVNFSNVDFDGITVQGPKWAGGLVGAGRGTATVSFTNCDTISGNSLTVKAGHQAGGLLGRSRQIIVNVNSTSGSSNIKIGEIVCMGKTSGDSANSYNSASLADAPKDGGGQNEEAYSCGGVTAYARGNLMTVKNLTLTDGAIKHLVMENDAYIGFAGGVLGHTFQPNFAFESVTVSGVSFDAEVVGGLIGGIASNQQSNCTIKKCIIDGLGTKTIQGRNKAGGVFGIMQIGQNNASIEISSTTVKRYTISQSYTISSNDLYACAGGLCAHLYYANFTGTTLKLFDDCVTDCTISSAYTTVAAGKGTGGLIGVITANQKTVNGYNLLVKDTIITSQVANSTAQNCGIFLGRNDTTTLCNLVGITFTGVTTDGTTPMTGETYITGAILSNANSYAVFADFAGETDNNPFSTFASSVAPYSYTNVALNPSTDTYAYVTTNPTTTIGVLAGSVPIVLTGEGASLSVGDLPIQSIVSDLSNNLDVYGVTSGRYSYAANNAYSATLGTTNYALFSSGYLGKMAMFSTEALSYAESGSNKDFPVYVIDSNDSATVTKMINSYLRLLTNTRISFEKTSEQTKYNFSTVFYRMVYDSANNRFTINTSDLSISRGDTYFDVSKTFYDSGKNQFTLMDVRFMDPSGSGKVAYHLYVPLFIRRVLSYRFDVAVRSGTTYVEPVYSPYYGDLLIENIGSPVTAYFKYTYERSPIEWLSVVNAGEDLHRNYDKELIFKKANNNVKLSYFNNDTIFVLIDPNGGGAYYLKLTDAISSSNTLDLQDFQAVLTKDGSGNIALSGDHFSPVDLDELLGIFDVVEDGTGASGSGPLVRCEEASATIKIGSYYYCPYTSGEVQRYRAVVKADSAAEDGSGKYVKLLSSAGATIKAGSYYYREYVESDGVVTKYAVTLNGGDVEGYRLEERYYLSIFTDAEPIKLEDMLECLSVVEDNEGPLVGCDEASATVTIGGNHYCEYESGEDQRYRAIIVADSAATNVSGAYIRLGSSSGASVKVDTNYYRPYTTSDGGATRYDISLDSEIIGKYEYEDLYYLFNYYKFHHYIISAPITFGDNDHPSVISDQERHTMAHLVVGKIFDHGNFVVTSYSSAEADPSVDTHTLIMSADNNVLVVNLEATMGVSDDLGSVKSEVMGYVRDTHVYQSFLVYLNRTEGNNHLRAIIGSPTCSGSYAIDDGAPVDYEANGTIRSTQNYAEFVSADLSSTFANSVSGFTVSAQVFITYPSSAIPSQFPGVSTLSPDNGVTVSGSSNISFSASSTTFSPNSESGDESPAKSYYSETAPETAILDLNPIGDKRGDFTPLGINALNNNDSNTASFDLLAVLEADAVSAHIAEYYDGVITITLEQKLADGTYGPSLTLSDYISSFGIEGIDDEDIDEIANAESGTSYTAVIEKAKIDDVDDLHAVLTLPMLHFTVDTGTILEGAGHTYGNYRITVNFVLRDSVGEEIEISKVSNFVIYTNAKLIPYYIG